MISETLQSDWCYDYTYVVAVTQVLFVIVTRPLHFVLESGYTRLEFPLIVICFDFHGGTLN